MNFEFCFKDDFTLEVSFFSLDIALLFQLFPFGGFHTLYLLSTTLDDKNGILIIFDWLLLGALCNCNSLKENIHFFWRQVNFLLNSLLQSGMGSPDFLHKRFFTICASERVEHIHCLLC